MITAEILKKLTSLGPKDLAVILFDSGYVGANFKSAKFLGLTNGNQFCYKITYFDDVGTGRHEQGKVFVTYNNNTDEITADY